MQNVFYNHCCDTFRPQILALFRNPLSLRTLYEDLVGTSSTHVCKTPVPSTQYSHITCSTSAEHINCTGRGQQKWSACFSCGLLATGQCEFRKVLPAACGSGSSVSISTELRAGRSGDRIPVGGGEIFRTCSDRPWGPPSLLYSGYRVFTGGKERPGRDADTSPLLVPWSKKCRAIPLLPLSAVRPVHSLSACTRVHFTFTFLRIDSVNCSDEESYTVLTH